MVNLKNKQTLYPDSVGAVFLLGGVLLGCFLNSLPTAPVLNI